MRRTLLSIVLLGLASACTQARPSVNQTSDIGQVDRGSIPNDVTAPPGDRPSPCPATQIECDRMCVDPSTSAAHCGGCGRTCPAGRVCLSGMCMQGTPDDVPPGVDVPPSVDVPLPPPGDRPSPCPEGRVECDRVCVDLASSAAHCGRCGNACPAGRACMAGMCEGTAPPPDAAPACPSGQITCGGACVSFTTDVRHCGGCGRACVAGQTCVSGSCVGMPPAPDGGAADAPPSCPLGRVFCAGFCVDPNTSAAHCGACGRACASGQTCTGGSCASAMDAGLSCMGGLTLCGRLCVSLRDNASNCGMCGNACPAGNTCGEGRCVSAPPPADAAVCPSGRVFCRDMCVDIAADPGNCGGCGNRCPVMSTCVSGTCSTPPADAGAMCSGGQMFCGDRCTDTQRDPNHCGRCFTPCPSGQTCAAGSCTSGGGCMPGFAMCGGVCSDVQRDTFNCGSCGVRCATGQVCTAGRCGAMMGCPSGQTMCGTACVDTRGDPTNCGRCGNRCSAGQVCTASVCGTCPSGQTLCTNAMGAMFCVDTQSDPGNCGGCGRLCPMATTTRCERGVCR